MVAEVLLQQLPVPVVVLLDIGLGMAVRLVLWQLVGLFQAWQVVIRYLQIIVLILGAGFPLCYGSGSGYGRIF